MYQNIHENEMFSCPVRAIHDEAVNIAREKMLGDGEYEKLSAFFKAICDGTRIKILYSLSNVKMCVCDIAALLNMTESAISHQLRLLKSAGLVKNDKQGKVVYYTLSDKHVDLIFESALEHVTE